MRYAVKVAYDGSLFHGSQRQSDDDNGSVEGALVQALVEMKQYDRGDPWPVEFSSRTDSGVSALGNVFALETDMGISELMKGLNSKMDGIWCIAYGRLREKQNVRWANSRWYRYHLPFGMVPPDNVKDFDSTLAMFVGSKDFTHFCRMEDGKDPDIFIERANGVDLTGNGEMVIADIVGSRFLWNQVRRMVGAAVHTARGDIEKDLVADLLLGKGASKDSVEKKGLIRTMPPTGLVLMDVIFKDVDFIVDQDAIREAVQGNSRRAWESSMRVILNSALRSISQ